MEMTPRTLVRRSLTTAFCMTTLAAAAGAQPAPGIARWVDSTRTLIDRAMLANRPDAFDGVVALLDRVLTVIPGDPILLHYKGFALYRKSNLMVGVGAKEPEIEAVLKEAEAALDESSKKLAWPETFALRSSVIGQQIGLDPNPINAMRLGPRADAALDRATELGPNNPRVWLLSGISLMFKPALFGGGLGKAERDLRKAIALFPTDQPGPMMPSWGHAEAFAWLGQVLARDNRDSDARAAYQKALEIEPNFAWVTNVLLPALDRKPR
jgi:tetratricopeptide (TPR) repeat protein